MNTDDGFDFLPAKYLLSNAKGEQVNLVSSSILGYTPTGLGVAFSNSYSQYDNYFSLTKSKINQGQMSLNILFGNVESDSYLTFSSFIRIEYFCSSKMTKLSVPSFLTFAIILPS